MNQKRYSIIWTALLVAIMLTGCSQTEHPPSPTPKSSSLSQKNTVEQPSKLEYAKQEETKKILEIPSISQKPELKNGCEVTSLAMLLQAAGHPVDKMTLAQQIPKDETPLIEKKQGNIQKWGDPEQGFVGDITGKQKGYAVYHDPLLTLLEKYLPARGKDLTGQNFAALQQSIQQEKPVVVWTTSHFNPPRHWQSWEKDGKTIHATLEEHAVLLVGYDAKHVYVNNPINGKQAEKIDQVTFLKGWTALGKQAISYD